ncbi:MAG: hypothetical protein VX642_06765 [Bdellovibrionota bacterium]|nr:hypothetical protein [Bdellovibrionota bacterium]
MYFFRGATPVAAFAAPCHPWGLLNPIHGIQNSEKYISQKASFLAFLLSIYFPISLYIWMNESKIELGIVITIDKEKHIHKTLTISDIYKKHLQILKF